MELNNPKAQNGVRMNLRDKKFKELKEWLKRWGNFTDKEVETYPYCMVDVMAIMEEYAKRKRVKK